MPTWMDGAAMLWRQFPMFHYCRRDWDGVTHWLWQLYKFYFRLILLTHQPTMLLGLDRYNNGSVLTELTDDGRTETCKGEPASQRSATRSSINREITTFWGLIGALPEERWWKEVRQLISNVLLWWCAAFGCGLNIRDGWSGSFSCLWLQWTAKKMRVINNYRLIFFSGNLSWYCISSPNPDE